MNPTTGCKVRLTKDIYDDGEDHHPPGYIAWLDEVVIVKEVYGSGRIVVAHEGNTGGFFVYPNEYKVVGST